MVNSTASGPTLAIATSRRRVLGAMAGASALSMLGSGRVLAANMPLRVAVVGGGIIGVTTAYHLARRGAEVTVVDPAPGQGCTQGAFAMLIAGHASGPAHFNDLYVRAVADWRRFEAEFDGALPVRWGGTLNWAAPGDRAEVLKADRGRLLSMGVDAQLLASGDIARLCPGAEPGPFGYGYFLPDQGAVDIGGVMAAIIAKCEALGVRFHSARAEQLLIANGACTALHTNKGALSVDFVVLAGGAENTRLAAMAGGTVPLELVSGTLAHIEPMPPLLSRVLNGPLGSIKQDSDGRIVTGLDYAPGADGTDTSAEYGRKLIATAASVVPALGNARLERMTLGHVPIPAHDQMPIVGMLAATPNVYVTSMMSGVTMAPLMARLVAAEVIDGLRLDFLSPFRPERFAILGNG